MQINEFFERKILLIFLFILLLECPAIADVVWPSLYISAGMASIKVIITGLLIEIFFVKFFTDTDWLKAGVITAVMNAITSILGIVLIPISGILLEFVMYPANPATFHWTHWVVSYLVIVIINTLIEGLVVKLTLKKAYKEILWWLFCANALSIIICVLFYGLRLGAKL